MSKGKKYNIDDVLKSFSQKGYCISDLLPDADDEITSDDMTKIIDSGYGFRYDPLEDELFYIDEHGDEVLAPDLSIGMSKSADWLSTKLPPVEVDIDQAGNVRKGSEADAMYKLLCIGCVLKDYADEIKMHFKNYDYVLMDSISGSGFKNMKMLLEQFQSLNSIRINSIISAAAIKISEYKEKSDSFYVTLLSRDQILGLSSLARDEKTIINKFEREKGLNPIDMKGMSKIQKLSLIDERNNAIERLISKSDVKTLYRISKLTTERIPPVIKSNIISEAIKSAEDDVIFNKLEGIMAEERRSKIKSEIIRKSYKAVLQTIKYNEILKYKASPETYRFKEKS
jgi:hypothetical protein